MSRNPIIMGGDLASGRPIIYLYISLGDAAQPMMSEAGHNPTTGNARTRSTVLGKSCASNPLNPALTPGSADPPSANGKYRVPQIQSFVGQGGRRAEIYV